jgi:hypothetical protein
MPTHRVPRAEAAEKLEVLARSRERVILVERDGDDVIIHTEAKVAAPGEREIRS